MVISMLKIRRPLERLIFNMGIAIPGKTIFLIETAHWFSFFRCDPFRITFLFLDYIKSFKLAEKKID